MILKEVLWEFCKFYILYLLNAYKLSSEKYMQTYYCNKRAQDPRSSLPTHMLECTGVSVGYRYANISTLLQLGGDLVMASFIYPDMFQNYYFI